MTKKPISYALTISLLSVLGLLTACVAVPPGGGGALIYNNYTTLHTVFPVAQGDITAEATARCYVSIVCLGDLSPHSIARANGIEVITSIDYRYTSANIFYSSTTLIVHGRKRASEAAQ